MKSIVDSETNNLSLRDVFEQIKVDVGSIPHKNGRIAVGAVNVPINYELVNLWSKTKKREEESVNVAIKILDPKGKELKIIEKTLKIPSDSVRIRARSRIQGLMLTVSGTYIFKVMLKQKNRTFKKVAEVPLEVTISN